MRTSAHISDLQFGTVTPPIQDELAARGCAMERSLVVARGDFTRQARREAFRTKACDVPGEVCKVVVTHHPSSPSRGEPRTDMVGRAGEALAVFEGCGVDMVLSGHLLLGYTGAMRTHYHAVVKRSILSVHAGTA